MSLSLGCGHLARSELSSEIVRQPGPTPSWQDTCRFDSAMRHQARAATVRE